jgi:hypothetical protein
VDLLANQPPFLRQGGGGGNANVSASEKKTARPLCSVFWYNVFMGGTNFRQANAQDRFQFDT